MVLRDDLLAGRRVAVAPAGAGAGGRGGSSLVAALGAEVVALDAPLTDEEALAAAGALGPLDALLVDAAAPFGTGGLDGLRAALDLTWNAVRAVAGAAWIPAGAEGGAAAVVLLAPRPAAGPHARAARAGLENMARTLSIEWARFGVRPMALAPGGDATDEEVAELAAFLVSPAGAYFSGQALAPA